MSYLLDTNVCINLINRGPLSVSRHFEEAVTSGSALYVSSLSSFELWYGVWHSERKAHNKHRLESFYLARLQTIPFDERDAQAAGALRNELEAIGKSIGPYDLLIAAQAKSRDLVLVTHNVREFNRIAGLVVQDWHQ